MFPRYIFTETPTLVLNHIIRQTNSHLSEQLCNLISDRITPQNLHRLNISFQKEGDSLFLNNKKIKNKVHNQFEGQVKNDIIIKKS